MSWLSVVGAFIRWFFQPDESIWRAERGCYRSAASNRPYARRGPAGAKVILMETPLVARPGGRFNLLSQKNPKLCIFPSRSIHETETLRRGIRGVPLRVG